VGSIAFSRFPPRVANLLSREGASTRAARNLQARRERCHVSAGAITRAIRARENSRSSYFVRCTESISGRRRFVLTRQDKASRCAFRWAILAVLAMLRAAGRDLRLVRLLKFGLALRRERLGSASSKTIASGARTRSRE